MIDSKDAKKRAIPEFTSYEEEARWWDTHDVTDYLDQFQPAQLVVAQEKVKSVYVNDSKKLESSLNVRFGNQTLDELREIASEKGVGPTTLVRMWVHEKLRELKRQYKTE